MDLSIAASFGFRNPPLAGWNNKKLNFGYCVLNQFTMFLWILVSDISPIPARDVDDFMFCR